MGKKNKGKINSPSTATISKKIRKEKTQSLLPWLLFVGLITAICLWPMLKNEFTNWDDEFYVVNNQLLRGPDWKGIFSRYIPDKIKYK